MGRASSYHPTFISSLRNKGIPDEYFTNTTGRRTGERPPIPQNYQKELGIRFLVAHVIGHLNFEDYLKSFANT
jgi:hypothetical protein